MLDTQRSILNIQLSMIVKDYYKILELPTNASKTDIKKAYRRLALRYHPDKQAGSAYAAALFQEVNEAYQVLYDDKRREEYHYERWAHSNYNRKKFDQRALTPEAIFKNFRELARYTASMDIFRMDQETVYYQLKQLLSDENIALLKEWNNEQINRNIIIEINRISQPLASSYLEKLIDLMMPLMVNDNNSIRKFHQAIQEKKRVEFWDKYKVIVVLITTILLCWMIFRAAK